MFTTCKQVINMSKMIQVRNVPDSIHRALKAKAALAGKSLSDWILEELEALAALPSEEELLERLREAEPFAMKRSSAKIIRKDRDAA
jgi:plasmid stability protein